MVYLHFQALLEMKSNANFKGSHSAFVSTRYRFPACLVSSSCRLGTAAPTAVSVRRFYEQVCGQERLLPIHVRGTGVSPACDMQHKADLAVFCPPSALHHGVQPVLPWSAALLPRCSGEHLQRPGLGQGFLGAVLPYCVHHGSDSSVTSSSCQHLS